MLVLFTLSVMKGSLGESIHDSGGSGGGGSVGSEGWGEPGECIILMVHAHGRHAGRL